MTSLEIFAALSAKRLELRILHPDWSDEQRRRAAIEHVEQLHGAPAQASFRRMSVQEHIAFLRRRVTDDISELKRLLEMTGQKRFLVERPGLQVPKLKAAGRKAG